MMLSGRNKPMVSLLTGKAGTQKTQGAHGGVLVRENRASGFWSSAMTVADAREQVLGGGLSAKQPEKRKSAGESSEK